MREGVCWNDKRLNNWKDKSVFLENDKDVFDAELYAILEVLGIVKNITQKTRNISRTTFCDLQKALQTIQHPFANKDNQFLRNLIYPKIGNF